MPDKRMAVLDKDNNIKSVIIIDPETSDWEPPEGCRLVEDRARIAAPGKRLSERELLKDREPRDMSEGPTLAHRVRELENAVFGKEKD